MVFFGLQPDPQKLFMNVLSGLFQLEIPIIRVPVVMNILNMPFEVLY
jgi:hypothetical protein